MKRTIITLGFLSWLTACQAVTVLPPRSPRGAAHETLFFVHVPKAGGSTVEAVLASFVGLRIEGHAHEYLTHQDIHKDPIVFLSCRLFFSSGCPRVGVLKRYFLMNHGRIPKRVRIVTGHYASAEIPAEEKNVVTVVRHPIERAISHYWWNLHARGIRQAGKTPNHHILCNLQPLYGVMLLPAKLNDALHAGRASAADIRTALRRRYSLIGETSNLSYFIERLQELGSKVINSSYVTVPHSESIQENSLGHDAVFSERYMCYLYRRFRTDAIVYEQALHVMGPFPGREKLIAEARRLQHVSCRGPVMRCG